MAAFVKGDEDFVHGRLVQKSYVRPNRIFTADAAIILRTVGKLSEVKVAEVVGEVVRIIAH